MPNVYKLILFVCLGIFIQSCTAKTKSYHNEFMDESLFNLENQSILMTNIRVKNNLSDKYYLRTRILVFEKDKKEIVHYLNSENTFALIDNEGFYNSYTLMTLDPGTYKMKYFRGISLTDTSKGAGFGTGFFQIPIFKTITVAAGKIIYIGQINAMMREKSGTDFAAGPVTPLIPQGNTKIAKGTFDINIQNKYLYDKTQFFKRYSKLLDKQVDIQIMDQWNRADLINYKPPTTHLGYFLK
ncbi:hypothetical protein DSCO28_63300 [Desulfosarcina ovata subsp. sediminis]|uniref:Lipoprotein n=1 Tax=Desulfosarcina ovata subsp. sediminis TaxID=885957 RepID=A0A5K8A047_9BACT|nr:hypothetical protein [Desulfosarcina ovata]BBO85764.1 hypothetical protein DSCO28_63300 [Desulfosarcina ovata subsp. sediminis]